MWAFMKAMTWASMECELVQIRTPEVGSGQPQRFIPVFDEYADAVKFAQDEVTLIAELQIK